MQNVLTSVISLSKKVSLTLFAFALLVSTAFGQHEATATEGHAAEEKFKPGEMIMHRFTSLVTFTFPFQSFFTMKDTLKYFLQAISGTDMSMVI